MNLEMVPVELIGLKTDLPQVVRSLKELGCVHIEDIASIEQISARPLTLDREMLRHQEELDLLLARIGGLLEALGCGHSKPHAPGKAEYLEEARSGVNELLPKVKTLTEERERLEAELSSFPRYEATLRKMLPILPKSAHVAGNKTIGVLIDRSHASILEEIETRVFEITHGQAEVVASDVDVSTRAMLLIFPEAYTQEIEGLLGREDISRLRLPAELGEGTPDVILAALHRRMATIPEKIKEINSELKTLADQWGEKLATWQALLQDDLDALRILPRFGETDLTFVLVGWVPARDFQRMEIALRQNVGPSVFIQKMEMTPELQKRAPVVLQNPLVAQPFESLIRLFALPRYGHIDPTRLTAFFLPIFFGMILGDVGYGLLVLIASVMLLRRFRQGMTHDLLIVLAMGSVWAIVFGILYGEAFGTLGETLGLHPLWFERTSPEHVFGLLVMTLAVGVVHITLGLLLGLWEAVKEKSRSHLLERGGMLIGLVGLFFLAATLVDFLPSGWMSFSIAMMITGIVILGASLGWLGTIMGPIEFLGLIGNILSYLRIAAIGLASVYLAKVANEVAGIVGNVIVGAILAVLIHALNLVMGVFSPTIHSLRLHYVEFFRKFYEGGGRNYEPFRSRWSYEGGTYER